LQVTLLRRVGGSDVHSITYNVLKLLVTNVLAEKFKAGKTKSKFKDLRLVRLVVSKYCSCAFEILVYLKNMLR